MKNFNLFNTLVALAITFGLTSCSVAEGIFKAGAWTGILAVVAVVFLAIWIIRKLIS